MKITVSRAWLVDTGERAGSAFAWTFLCVWLAPVVAAAANNGDVPHALHGVLVTGVAWKAIIAAGAPALAIIKAALATARSNTMSPASLAPAEQPGQAKAAAPPDSDAAGITRRQLDRLPAPDRHGRRLGRRPKPPDPRDLPLRRYLRRSAAKAIPAAIHWGRRVNGFPMLLNDRLGDCGEAGWLHLVQVWLANVGHRFTPTDAQALALYEHVAGYRPGDPATDQGTVLRDLLKYVRTHRVAGRHRILAFVAVDPHNHDQVKTAISLFGALYVGVNLTQDAYRNEGVHWHVTRGPGGQPDPNLGHCVIYTGYDRLGLDTVTWGQRGRATWSFHDRCCDELWAAVSLDWMNAAGVSPSHLNRQQLEQDLAAL